MIPSKEKSYGRIKKLLKILGNIVTGIQILAILLMLLCILHIAFGVFQIHILDFANPLINSLKDFTTMLYGTNIKHDRDGIDGREVLFILSAMVATYFFAQLRMILDSYVKNMEHKIVEEKEKAEEAINKKMQLELEKETLSQTSFVLAVQFKVRGLTQGTIGAIPPSPEELGKIKMEALGKFYEEIKTFSGVKFSKDDDILIISGSNVNNVDVIIEKIMEIISKLKAKYKVNQYGLRVKLAIESHKPMISFNTIYRNLTPLFGLNAYNEVLCYGNFKNRYELIKNSLYYVSPKGRYELGGKDLETIYCLIKKN